MNLETFQYTLEKGWSVPSFPALDSAETLILIFSAPEFLNNPKPIEELSAFYKQAKMIGCSSAGEILGSNISDHSLSVAVIKFEKTPLKTVKIEIKDAADSYNAGNQIAKELNQNDLCNIFVLSDGLNVNGSELVKGINSIGKENVVVTGGLAGDGPRFKNTWAIFDGKIYQNQVVAVGLYGKHVHIGHGSRGGWDIFGPERRITRSKNNILYELDNQPALSLYKKYLGERASGLPATGLLFPLAIRKNAEESHQLVRTILAIDEKDQSLTFAGDVPTGYLAQLMRANFDRLITGASEAGELAKTTLLNSESTTTNPVLSIAVSCVGRRLLLGERTEEETESTLESLPPKTQQVGFYSYGELSPFATGQCDLHNQTMTITTITEE
jgi:hypothetical protein